MFNVMSHSRSAKSMLSSYPSVMLEPVNPGDHISLGELGTDGDSISGPRAPKARILPLRQLGIAELNET